ncbi:phage portal protein [Bifidobacterium biavatii]|uniref:Phage portal protein n=1 Tax=Bifidobacterium biavatii DSM 23969 TaxID=1437608 RepID=A0A086ZU22_9BIFI|nr:phage portal protein [Bifidobacterium biavatii]KFI50022.1 phage portal protein [Bifidobacterium biavatii DSM 23969]
MSEDLVTARSQIGWLAVESAHIGRIQGVADDDQPVIQELLKAWRNHYARNTIRTGYYLAHYHYKGVAYSIPPAMKTMARPMIGWPNKAVRALADLSVFEGVDAPDALQDQVDALVADTMLDVKVSQAIVSAYTHGCSFLTVSADEGRTVITPRAADWSSALWDWRNNRIGAALTMRDKDRDGRITGFDVWLPGKVYLCSKTDGGGWTAATVPTGFDRPTVVPLISDQQLYRPFGSSRITRSLMALTDFGLRTLVRMEATAEFYAAPRIWFLGADKSQVSPDTWGSIVSVINGVPASRSGDKPDLRQLTQASMQPHSDMLKTIALMVSSETDIPVNDLGITMDNPASAEAMAEAERKLSRTADRQNKRFSQSIRETLALALLNDGADEADVRQLRPLWAPTKEASDAARADWYAKVAGVNPLFADSDVGLSRAGLTWDEIRSHRSYERQERSRQAVDELRAKLTLAKDNAQEETADGQHADESAVGQSQPAAAANVPNPLE